MADPKLKEAMAELAGIMKKHDITGSCIMISETHSEIRHFFESSWSSLTMEEVGDGVGVRIRITKADFPDKEVRRQKAELSAHVIYQLRDLHGASFMASDSLCKELEKHMTVEHIPFRGYEPHREN